MQGIKNKKILVVDDTPANLDLLHNILNQANYQVRALPDGKMALYAVMADPPDLVLLDIKMPNMDGYEICTRLKADERTRDIPIIFISALYEPTDKIKAFAVGGIDYITKPFQSEEVLVRVKTHLNLRASQQQLIEANTQIRESMLQAQAANRAKSTFLANMSHELRTPLNAVLGYAQILTKEPDLKEEHRHMIDIISRSGDHLLGLLNDVLDLAKVEAGHFDITLTPCSLQFFLQDIGDIFSIRCQEKELAFHYDSSNTLPEFVEIDQRRIRQIIMNLLGNAIKFTEKGSIHFYRDYYDGCLVLTISDTGIGISEDKLEEIFKPFQQTGEAYYKTQGTGLGLTISRKLCELMNGSLKVESQLGQGSRFQVKIPAAIVEKEAEEIAQAAAMASQQITGYTRLDGDAPFAILAVDDRQDNLNIVKYFLQNLNFQIREALSGEECLHILSEWQPDLILMDLRMDGISGLEACQRIRALSIQTPIIIMSASVLSEEASYSANQIQTIGCNDYLSKPLREHELLSCIGNHLPLCWHKQESTISQLAVTNVAPSIEALSDEQRTTLLTMLGSGDIKRVSDYLAELEQLPDIKDTAKALLQLAKGFKLKELRRVLKNES